MRAPTLPINALVLCTSININGLESANCLDGLAATQLAAADWLVRLWPVVLDPYLIGHTQC